MFVYKFGLREQEQMEKYWEVCKSSSLNISNIVAFAESIAIYQNWSMKEMETWAVAVFKQTIQFLWAPKSAFIYL